MRAVLIRDFDALDTPDDPRRAGVAQVADPIPEPGQVLVAVDTAPVNYVDLVTARGKYQFRPELPYIPGKGPAGVVRTVHPDVTDLCPGQRVLAMAEYGGYAELVAVDRRSTYPIPDSVSFAEAASLSLAFDTAWVALTDRARLRAGETVLVLGATGAVGGAAVQLARAMGASRVLAGVSSNARCAAAIGLGADVCVDLSAPQLRNSLREQVYAANDGQGVDVVIDPLGDDAFDGAVRALAWRGRLVVVGFAAGRIPTLKMNYPMLKNIEVGGLQISDYRKRMPELLGVCYRELFTLIEQRRVAPSPTTALPLADWREAMRLVQSRDVTSRVVLNPRA